MSKDIHILHEFTVGTAIPHAVLPEVESWKFLTPGTHEAKQLFWALRNITWAEGRPVKDGFRAITPDKKVDIEYNKTAREVTVILGDGNVGGLLGKIVLSETGIINRNRKDARYTQIPCDLDSSRQNRRKTIPWTEHKAIVAALASVIKDPVAASKEAHESSLKNEFKASKKEAVIKPIKEPTEQQENVPTQPKKASNRLLRFWAPKQ
ncbi:MAG TPA: hypothetical protein DCY07_00125 [Rhodospirillaceae bacterium]|nr:hypothetical protein [Rhodospirillaceae bacterium]